MFKFFRRKPRTTAAPEPQLPIFGERISTASPAAREYAKRLLTNLQVTEPFAEPDSDEHALWKAGKLVPFYITYLLDAGGHVGPASTRPALQKNRGRPVGDGRGVSPLGPDRGTGPIPRRPRSRPDTSRRRTSSP